ncbi:HD domain-containing protein [Methanoculleus sp. Wushi-C6]|uniref:HD domain-containing protein n=1 Tax=Methanoculleus caldifontis TaxID=2651577 RepID=A0ABU3WY10_9EURY|nr:HD domain-containing protein [Methanoculleus sp. Wushi-C6]MDV2480684.1 HD domain-containing protein [Methanoculleus sp. Wushi-C6]
MKIIKDPVHGYVEADATTLRLLDSEAVQRLRHVSQLGFANLVYPGANHTRFEHSLGTMHLAGLMCRELDLDDDETKLVTAAALLHDIGHGPFSHVTEPVMEEFTGRSHHEIGHLVGEGAIAGILESEGIDPAEVCAAVSGEHPLASIIHGSLDVDRMDYLMRDAHYTGVPYGTVDAHRLIRCTILTGSGIALHEGGINAAESLLIARTLMRPAVYFHHVSRIATSMFVHALREEVRNVPGTDAWELMRMDDAACMERLKHSSCPIARDLARRVYYRDLYKRALYVGEDRVNAAAFRQDPGPAREREIAIAIAEIAGIPAEEVLVDIPPLPGALSMEVRVRNSHAMLDLEEVSPLINTMNDTRRQQWRLGVYTTQEHRDAVEQAATEILRVKRATKQDKLVVA